MKHLKTLSLFLAAALITVSLAGCGDSSVKTNANDSSAQNAEDQIPAPGERGTMAKVVSLDGDTITVILASNPGGGPGGGTPPAIGVQPAGGGSGATPPAIAPESGTMPQDGAAPPDGSTAPSNGSGSAGSSVMPDGQPPQDMEAGGKIEFNGEQKTYTLSTKLTVTKGMGENAAEIDLSEIKADSVISFTTETDDSGKEIINRIQIME